MPLEANTTFQSVIAASVPEPSVLSLRGLGGIELVAQLRFR
jgi:hypothetical protein